MKNLLLLCFGLSLTTLAVAQQKPEFGFVVKAGTYTLPSKTSTTSFYFGNSYSTRTVSYFAGQTYTLGIWQSFPLGSHFRLSGELLYRASSFKTSEHLAARIEDGGNWYESSSYQTEKISENSLSLPVKLHFSFKKEGKMSVSLGGGLSRTFYSTIQRQSNTSWHGSFAGESHRSINRLTHWEDFNLTYNLGAGIHYRLDQKTTFGLEFSREKTRWMYNNGFSNFLIFCDCTCECSGYLSTLQPNLNSFSVSLRHNILD